MLRPDHLTRIYQYLDSPVDVLQASLTCRSWCWMLWRDEEQLSLWTPRIASVLRGSSEFLAAIQRANFAKLALRRELGYETPDAVLKTFEDARATIFEDSETLARVLFRSGILWKACLRSNAVSSIVLPRTAVTTFFAGDRGHGARYRESFTSPGDWWCFLGKWNNIGFIFGSIICNGKMVYYGELENAQPHGHGTLYNAEGEKTATGQFRAGRLHGQATVFTRDGNIYYQGEIDNGDIHGMGKLYYDDSAERRLQFSGFFAHDKRERGTWYDMEGNLVFQGDRQSLQKKLIAVSSRPNHQCTFSVTGRCYIEQQWYRCRTCFETSDNNGVCSACAARCHQGHDLELHEESEFFCDCGADGDCNALDAHQSEQECNCIFVRPSQQEQEKAVAIDIVEQAVEPAELVERVEPAELLERVEIVEEEQTEEERELIARLRRAWGHIGEQEQLHIGLYRGPMPSDEEEEEDEE